MSQRSPTVALVFAALVSGAGCEPPHAADVGYVDYGQIVCARGPTVEGIDISHWNGAIDWNKVKGAGKAFAVMKATEHLMFVDNTFATNWKGAGQAGVIRGAYHFFRPALDGVMQADWFLKNAGMPGPGDLPPTLDLEVEDGVPDNTVAARALDWLNRVEQVTGRTPMIYTSARVMQNLGNPPGFARFPVWVAHWGVQCPNIPPEWKDWHLWQYTDSGMVAGIGGAVDLDRFNGSLADLMAFVNPPMPDAGAPRDMAPARDLAGAADGSMMSPPDAAADLAGGLAPDLAPGPAADLAGALPAGQDLAGIFGGGAVVSGCGCAVGGGRRSDHRFLTALLAWLGMAAATRGRRSRPSRR